GFAGTETLASQRDWNANQTTLEGNSRIAYKSSILINVLGDNAAIDGFIISGSVDALVVENKNNISVSNCKFVNNNVGTKITNSSITFENSFFLNNNAYSGLLILNSNSNVTTTNCTFSGNDSAITLDSGDFYAYNTIFYANTNHISIVTSGTNSANTSNCLFFEG